MSVTDDILLEFLRLVDKSIDRSIVMPDYRYSRTDLISLFHANFRDKDLFSEVLDLCFFYGFLDAADKSQPVFDKYYLTLQGRKYIQDPASFSIQEGGDHEALQNQIDSTEWTGLGKRISPEQAKIIREKSQDLLLLIMQSDADLQTRIDASKRVEAVVLLLEAPNVPWREIVGLLNSPSVAAFLAALNLIQFIIGIAS